MILKNVSRFGMKMHLNQIQGPKQLLALDIGINSIAIAISCLHLQKAYYHKVMKVSTSSSIFWKFFQQTLRKNKQIQGIIVGKAIFPEQKNFIDQFVRNVGEKTQTTIPYCFVEDQFTLDKAETRMKSIKEKLSYHGHLHNEDQLIQGLVAVKLLESYLSYHNER